MNEGISLYLINTVSSVRILLWVLLALEVLSLLGGLVELSKAVKNSPEYLRLASSCNESFKGLMLAVLFLCIVPTKAEMKAMTSPEKPSTEVAGKP